MNIQRISIPSYGFTIGANVAGGVITLSQDSALWTLTCDHCDRARLCLYDAELIPILSYDLEAEEQGPLHDHFRIALANLPLSFGYSWQIHRDGKWHPPCADPFHPWLAGTHHWRKPAPLTISWVDLSHWPPPSQPSSRPGLPMQALRIYETHIRGATHTHPDLKTDQKGTLEGMHKLLDHIEQLGFNAIEIMPLHEFDETHLPTFLTGSDCVNFWGYMPVHPMAVMRAYSIEGSSIRAEQALKHFVQEAHRRGIEVIVDIVFNHVDSRLSPVLFCYPHSGFHRNPTTGELIDYTGCGHTLDTQTLAPLLLHTLRYWADQFDIDGVRFDLAAALARSHDGSCRADAPFFRQLLEDPVLNKLKFIMEPWDTQGGWLVGQFAAQGFYEWNDRFRDDIRAFINFGHDKARAAMRLSGSEDLYHLSGSPRLIHYLTSHDGFSLCDLVSYDKPHNLRNGEGGRDGEKNNHSRNHGVEGPTQEPAVIELRNQQMDNFMLALALSHGPLMMRGGDEYGHSTQGNNNSWCHDQPWNELNWSKIQQHPPLMKRWQALMQWRQKKPLLISTSFYSSQECTWYDPDGRPASWAMDDPLLIMVLHHPEGKTLAVFNPSAEERWVQLPPLEGTGQWQVIVDNRRCGELLLKEDEEPEEGNKVFGKLRLIPWASALLEAAR